MATIIYAIMHALLSILIPAANIPVVFVVYNLMRRKHAKSYMFILNLAAADLLVGVMCVVEALDDIFDDDFDKNITFCLLRICLTITPCIGSILTLLLISFDRYLAVRFPLYYLRIMTTRNIVVLIVSLWGISFILGHLPLLLPSLQRSNYTGFCGLLYAARGEYVYIICFSIFVPVLTTLIYIHIALCRIAYLQYRSIKQTWIRTGALTADLRHFKAVRTVLIVIACFALSWGPYYITGVVQATCATCNLVDLLKDLLFLLGETNSLVNPLIYAFYSKDIRTQLYRLLFCQRQINSPNFRLTKAQLKGVPCQRESTDGDTKSVTASIGGQSA
ncbi:glucose-dependent insulinotropic receptor [Protopterus annectens]|uniref:glucose-dependent insulinotropic receptor n=1 Tax=Protopterus annectens TaxID=7888 RepID=UPI001CFBEB63|nr:glucose-dependent insulinotropic receptor [Protopterus annectens]